MAETVRLRVVFDDRHMLSKTKKKEGLKRCWVLLKPQHNTISDLESYLLYTFGLDRTCPNGIILSMGDFVLPPFESTCILRDEDIVCVKRKGNISTDYKRTMLTSPREHQYVEFPKLLTNEKFQEETGTYKIESPEDDNDQSEDATRGESKSDRDAVSKKRKASKKLHKSGQKKIKLSSTEKLVVIPKAKGSLQDNVTNLHSRLFKKNNDTSSSLSSQQDKSSTQNLDKFTPSNKTSGSLPCETRLCQPQDDGKGNVDVSNPADNTKKLPSRSARRKKAKRQWLREQVKLEKEKLHQNPVLEKDGQQLPVEVSNCITSNANEEPDGESEAEDDIVPIEIRPGHFRFEPLRKDQSMPQNQHPVETFQWNGITSKKKGQKWGKEKVSVHKRDDYKLHKEESPRVTNAEEKHTYTPVEFDKLTPCTSLPKEGDVIAYRLIELSASWTPELSSYKVGKVSQYDPETKRIKLVLVPEYKSNFDKRIDEEASSLLSDPSPYGQDGSLEIDYVSLADVRLVKHGNVDSSNVVAIGETLLDETRATNGRFDEELDDETAIGSYEPHNKQDVDSPAQEKENGEVNMWDEINEALTAKKSQLSKERSWSKQESSGTRSWSHKTLRCGALGPTMARLRAHNALSETNQH